MIRLILFSLVIGLWPVAAFGQVAPNSLIISEFMPNPTGELETEWIELSNKSNTTLNLRDFQIGDELKLRTISDSDLFVYPNEFVILAQDVDRFNQYYPIFFGSVISPVGWQVLNNSGGETIKLGDSLGTVIDSFHYDASFSDNRSWERYIDSDGNTFWGASFAASGSTPGIANSFFFTRAQSIDLSVDPDPFSPQLDIYTTIKYNLPESSEFDLAIYDLSGLKVKTFFDSAISAPGEVRWDGRDDNGEFLPIGIYIIYAKVDGQDQIETKKTVVIAR